MSDFSGIKINKIGGGLGRRSPSTDSIFGLVLGGVAASGLALSTPAKLIQLSDAEDLGITAAYDSTNEILVHHHISEYFRLNPNGTLYIMLVPQTATLANMCDKASEYVKKLILSETANREIKYLGVVRNPDMATYTPVLSGGLDSDVLAAIPKAQELIDTLRTDNIYIDGIMLEGREFNGTIAAATDLTTLAAQNVGVVIAQDPAITALATEYAKYAAVGAALGMISVRKVSENMGSVDIVNKPDIAKGKENYPLTNAANGLWLKAALSSGVLVNALSQTEKTALTQKGYIFAGSYEGYPYVYFNNSTTCTASSDDFSRIEKNRTWNKAARYCIETLTPRINSTVKIDENTGFIKSSTVASWESAVKAKLGNMLADDEVSAIDVYIDPKQNVLSGSPVKVKLSVTPDGIAEAIEVDLGFKNPFA
jgi:hypothetical protein